MKLVTFFICALVQHQVLGGGSPPPGSGNNNGDGGSTSGSDTSTRCTVADGTTCNKDGSTNEIFRELSYDSATGIFSGSIVANGCPDHTFVNGNTATCFNQTFPAPDYASGPNAAPLRGRLGLTLSGGTNIYGPMEAGFADGTACTGGDCEAGLDVVTCEAELEYECASTLDRAMFMDSCGGHATPYHHHTDLVCKYNTSDYTAHSPLIGIALDGYGIYGKWEGADQERPCVDSCRGHTDTVPGGDTWGLTSSSSVYHYHTSDWTDYPNVWTIGCFGPANTKAACEALYSSTCGTDTVTVVTSDYPNGLVYDTDCPCYDPPSCGIISTSTTPSVSPSVSISQDSSANTQATVLSLIAAFLCVVLF